MKACVRGYCEADRLACRALWAMLTEHHRDIYEDQGIGGEDPGLEFDDHLAKVGESRIWVAELNGSLCGLVGLEGEGEEAAVEPVIVTPGLRGKGIGHLLLEHAVQAARAQGVRFLSVHPVARNESAIGFFAARGFQTLGFVDLFMELTPSDRRWKHGIEMHGRRFRY